MNFNHKIRSDDRSSFARSLFKRTTLSFVAAWVFGQSGIVANAGGGNIDIYLKKAYSPAVVKIITTGDEDNRDDCRNVGTGFFIGPKHIATAAHVLNVTNGEKCGRLNYSAIWNNGTQYVFLKLIAFSVEDVAILEAEQDLPVAIPSPCSLVIASEKDFSQHDGWRMSVREFLPEVATLSVQSYSKTSPFVRITGTDIWEGDSGGPVLVDGQVAGLVHERDVKAPGIGSMVKSQFIADMMHRSNVPFAKEKLCNFALVDAGPDYASIILDPANVGLVSELNSAAMNFSLPSGWTVKFATKEEPVVTLKSEGSEINSSKLEAKATELKKAFDKRLTTKAISEM